jgi:hypothetical protein
MINLDKGGSMTVFGSDGYQSCGIFCGANHSANATARWACKKKKSSPNDGHDKVFFRDRDNDDTFETVEYLDVTINTKPRERIC